MLTVNLFDDSFRHDACSTAWKTPKHIRYVRDRMEFDGITLFTDGYVNKPELVDSVKSPVKVGWLHEPECLHPHTYADSLKHGHHFDFILTYYAPFLFVPDYRGYCFAPYAGTWIRESQWGIRPKTYRASMLFGTKMSTLGHRIRHDIADAVSGVDLFGARGEPTDYSPDTKYRVLADHAFSIVVETCRQDNLFTEILLDCFTIGTIPIFWGAPNVGEFFNADGMLSFETVEECRAIVSGLSWELYASRAQAIADNFERVKQYAITEDWLYENVLKDIHIDKRLSA